MNKNSRSWKILHGLTQKDSENIEDDRLDFSSDDSVTDKTYIPENASNHDSDDHELIEQSLSHTLYTESASSSAQTEAALSEGSRWRKQNSKEWKRNKNKELRNQCQPYQNYKGVLKEGKHPQSIVGHSCKYSCRKFDENERLNLCQSYWSLSSYNRKKDYILKNVESNTPVTHRPRSNSSKFRTNAKTYFFNKNCERIRVCQHFFLKTLNISNRSVLQAFIGKDELGGHFCGEDNRGKHSPINKTKPDAILQVKQHIESFPSMESHYSRKNTKRKYLDSNLSIKKMYSLYKEMCVQKNFEPVSEITYRRIFCKLYNFSFFKPKKDQCLTCNRYKISSAENKITLEDDYQNHLKRKTEALHEKEKHKERANCDPSFMSVTLDMQSVLQIPSTDVSLTYYKRKLIFHNFTIYEAPLPNQAFCYAWTEVHGRKGSCEIGSCLLKYVQQLPANVKELSFFSDTCGGQNRNLQISALFLNLVQTSSIDIIEQVFLESGHSYMEVDSMHSAIEKQKRFMPVYCVNDWINIFKLARGRTQKLNKPPYTTNELKFQDFYDFKFVAERLIKNKSLDETGDKINWLKVKAFKYEKSKPFIIQYKYNYREQYKSFNTMAIRKGRPPAAAFFKIENFPKLYREPLKISIQKKKDLIELCQKGVIPEIFHSWFASLPCTQSVAKDYLPEADVDDGECDQ